jgi:hypothetical protein
MVPGRASVLVVVIGAAAAALNVSCHPSTSSRIELGNSDNGRSLAVAVGDEIDVTLQTIGPGQYDTPTVSSGAVQFLGESLAGAPNPGGPTQLFRFEAAASGRVVVTLPHAAGLLDGPVIPAFGITVTVY